MKSIGIAGSALATLALTVAGAEAIASPVGDPDRNPRPAAEKRGKEFWRAFVKDCAAPGDTTVVALVEEITAMLGSTDSEWRDDFGYGVVARCVYRKRLLEPRQRHALAAHLSANLKSGLGESGTDTVLLRSFSALDLSLLAALDLEDPFLGDDGFRRLLDAALAYLRDERDVRGFDPRVGWMHSAAHTADLLKFLARSKHLRPADHARIVDAVEARFTRSGDPVYTHAEDERLANVLVSLAQRDDVKSTVFDGWLLRAVERELALWNAPKRDAATLAAAQNSRALVRAFYVALSLPSKDARPEIAGMRTKVLTALRTLQRN